mmetsp:Transcript_20151/g.47560  ORF Transcript_20151/g.47560 Transcript_20151/m.47560 type:complete len:293 (+) Transcript_20151:479-1357(+)
MFARLAAGYTWHGLAHGQAERPFQTIYLDARMEDAAELQRRVLVGKPLVEPMDAVLLRDIVDMQEHGQPFGLGFAGWRLLGVRVHVLAPSDGAAQPLEHHGGHVVSAKFALLGEAGERALSGCPKVWVLGHGGGDLKRLNELRRMASPGVSLGLLVAGRVQQTQDAVAQRLQLERQAFARHGGAVRLACVERSGLAERAPEVEELHSALPGLEHPLEEWWLAVVSRREQDRQLLRLGPQGPAARHVASDHRHGLWQGVLGHGEPFRPTLDPRSQGSLQCGERRFHNCAAKVC